MNAWFINAWFMNARVRRTTIILRYTMSFAIPGPVHLYASYYLLLKVISKP